MWDGVAPITGAGNSCMKHDNKNTKLIIIQYISIKIIKKNTHKYIKTSENNISVNAQSNTLPHPTELIKN